MDSLLRRFPHHVIDTGGLWVWREVEEIDLTQHVRRVTLPAGSGLPEMWQLVSDLHSERLDLSVSLWSSCLIDGLPAGRFALYIKVHHTIIDGVGGLRLATVVGSLTSDTVKAPLEAPRTRFNAKLGPRRAAAGSSLDRARIRAVQEAGAVTANDVITALVGSALRHWMIRHDELPEQTLVAMCPVSVRSRDDEGAAQSGNQFGLGLCPLGTDVSDDAERLALIHDAMSNIKHQVSDKGSDAMLAVMGPAIGSTVVQPILGLPNPG